MKKITAFVSLIFLIILSFSCKSTQQVTEEQEPVRRQEMSNPNPTQEQIDYYTRQPKRGEVDPADVQQIVDYAKEKASLTCKIHKLDEQGAANPLLAEENKQKIISLEQSIKGLDASMESFMDSQEKWHYFNKVYEKELEKCQ